MQRFDRILGILLFLRSKHLVSAAELARQFEASTRTIYRDLETLSALGVPVLATWIIRSKTSPFETEKDRHCLLAT